MNALNSDISDIPEPIDIPPSKPIYDTPDLKSVQLARLYRNYVSRQVEAGPETTKEFGRQLVGVADSAIDYSEEAYRAGDKEKGDFAKEMAITVLDIALSLTPGVGLGKDIYEAYTGIGLVSGEKLSGFERSMAVVGILTAGIGSKLALIGKAAILTDMMKAGKGAEEAAEVLTATKNAEKILDSAKNNLPQLRKTVEFLKRGDIPSVQRREVIEAFTDNSKVVTLVDDIKVYRYWVEGFNGPKGHWVTRKRVSDPLRELALPNSGPYKEAEWMLPKGTEILEGMAAPNFKQPGGAGQIYISNPGVLQ